MKKFVNLKSQIIAIGFILFMASCISMENSQVTATAIPATLTPAPGTQTPPTPTKSPYSTPQPTSTLPPPLPTLQLTQPPAGLLFNSFSVDYSKPVLHQVLMDGQISRIANADEHAALLSNHQRFVAFVRYVPADAQSSSLLSQLWVRDTQRRIEKQITPPANCDVKSDMFNWAPDDSRLYYFVSCGHDRDLWYINTKTWETKNLTANANRTELCFYFLGDGRCVFHPNSPERILIASEPMATPRSMDEVYIPRWVSSRRLTEVNANTGEYQVLDEDAELFESPSIAPNGNGIAYDRGHLLYKDGRREKLPVPDFGLTVFPEEVVDLVNPSWSPDGKTIAWDAAHIDGFNLTALVFYDVPSKTFREVLRFQPYYWNITICVCDMWYKRPSAWSPDGRYFAYTVDESVDRPTSTNSNMFLEEHATLRVFDKQGKVMFSMKDADWKLAWSPDGKWLAFYASDRNIYSMRVYILRVDEWKAYKVDLPFERVRLEGWVNPQP